VTSGYSPPLQVMGFVATRSGDPDRGPLVRMRADDAAKRLLNDGELAWVYGPRRHELATVVVDDGVPRGGVIVRDIAGVAPSEIVRVVKVDLDSAGRRGNLV
jgi:anaerobic selenocysteine-containing dehydrogenase